MEVCKSCMIEEIERIWDMYPSQRFGQLIFNLYAQYAGRSGIPNCFDYFHCDDEGFLKFLKAFKGFN